MLSSVLDPETIDDNDSALTSSGLTSAVAF
jgi:hypothetical protein